VLFFTRWFLVSQTPVLLPRPTAPSLPRYLVSVIAPGVVCDVFRVVLDGVGGLELDVGGAKRRQWRWRDDVHVHAPPLYPLTVIATGVVFDVFRVVLDRVGGLELDIGGAKRRQWRWRDDVHVHAPPLYPLSVIAPGVVCDVFRVVLDRVGGLELDVGGAKRRQWRWRDDVHVHAPPLYPLTVSLSSHCSLHIRDQFDVKLTFSCAQRTCTFSVSASRQVCISGASHNIHTSMCQLSLASLRGR